MKHKLQMEPEALHQAVIDSVTYARNLCDDVVWSPEDGTRTAHDILYRTVEPANKAEASTINIPDTVANTPPHELPQLRNKTRRSMAQYSRQLNTGGVRTY